MGVWKFCNGRLEAAEDFAMGDVADCATWMESQGYGRWWTSEEHAGNVDIWVRGKRMPESAANGAYRYCVWVSIGLGEVDEIWVPDLPELLDLLPKLQPLIDIDRAVVEDLRRAGHL